MGILETSRRSALKFFGIGAVGAAAAIPVATATQLPKTDKNPFNIPSDLIPRGMRYEWKRAFIDRQQHDMNHLADLMQNGWRPVPFARHKDFFPDRGWHNWIEVGGLVLMEKPIA